MIAIANEWAVSERVGALHAACTIWGAHTCLPLMPAQSVAELERHRPAGVPFATVNVGMDLNPVSQIIHVIASFRAWLT